MQEWGVIISAAGLAILVLTSVGGLVWKLSRIEIGLRAEYSEEIAEIKADAVKELAALSAKLYQVEESITMLKAVFAAALLCALMIPGAPKPASPASTASATAITASARPPASGSTPMR
jgi:hypothetical protein